jgi:hypothetical protein
MERQLIPLPGGPTAQTGLAQMMPGPDAVQVNPRSVSAGRVRLNTQAPQTAVRVGGVQASGEQLAQGEMQAARATFQTGQAFAQTITDIGQGISQVAQRIIIARESAELMEADAIMKGAAERYKAGLSEDPGGWKGGFDGVVQSVRGDLLNDPDKRMSKPLKRKLEQNIKAWEAENRVGLETMAMRQNLNIAKAKSEFAFEEAVARGDLMAATQYSAQRVAMGLSTQDLEDIRLTKAKEQIQRQNLTVQIYQNPSGVRDYLTDSKPSWMTDLDKIKTLEGIDRRESEIRISQMDELDNLLAERPDIPETEFRQQLDATALTPEQKKTKLDQWREGRPPDFDVMTSLWTEMNQQISPTSKLVDVWKYREKIKDQIHKDYYSSFIGHLSDLLQQPSVDDSMSSDQRIILSQAKRQIEAAVGQSGLDTVMQTKAQIALETAVTNYMKNKPTAPIADVLKYVEDLGVPTESVDIDKYLEPGVVIPGQTPSEVIEKAKTELAGKSKKQMSFWEKILAEGALNVFYPSR